MEIKYTLVKEEVKEALLLTGKIKSHKTTSIVQTVLCGILIVVFLMNVIWSPGLLQNYLFMAVGIILIPVVWIFPQKTINRIAETAWDKREIRLELMEGLIIVNIDSNNIHWEAPADRVFKIEESPGLYIVELTDKRLIAIPKRAVPQDKVNKAEELLKTLDLPDAPEDLVE